MTGKFNKHLAFLKDESGSGSIEACLWVPALFGFFVLVFDASYVFLRDGEIRRVMHEGNRQYVKGLFASQTEALETWIEAEVSGISPNAEATATVDSTTGLLTTTISYPASDTDVTGWMSALTGLVITVQAVNQTEV